MFRGRWLLASLPPIVALAMLPIMAFAQTTAVIETEDKCSTAIGWQALYSNLGYDNTASGCQALYSNTTGSQNTATGYGALHSNTTGINNTAVGMGALGQNEASGNNAFGAYSLTANTTGQGNVAIGLGAVGGNTTGEHNTGTGWYVMDHNTTGRDNVAYGSMAMKNNNGDNNIAIGKIAGAAVTTGSNNIWVGNMGVGRAGQPDAPDDQGVIRIGTTGLHLTTWIAGIADATLTEGSVVGVASDGQLGVLPSDLLPAGPQGPAGPGLVPGSLLFLPSNIAPPAGYVLLGRTDLALTPVGADKPPKLKVYVYQKL